MNSHFKQTFHWLKKYENVVYILLAYLLSLAIFRFSGLMNFYDLITVPYIHNYTDPSVVLPYNFLRNLGLPPQLITSLLFQLIFTATTILSFFSLKKILPLLGNDNRINAFQIFLISLIYTYNPWTFERFLMGQYKVLAGTGMLIWGIYEIFRFFDKTDFEISKQLLFKALRLGLVIGLIGYAGSLHSAGFLFIVLGLGLVVISAESFSLNLAFFKKSFSALLLVVLIVLPTLALQLSKYVGTTQLSYYQQNLETDTSNAEAIIRSFQIRTHLDDQNLYVRALVGSAGWMKSAREFYITPIQNQLGWAGNFLYYYNDWLGLILIVGVVVWLVYFIVRLWKSKLAAKKWLLILLVTSGLSLVLNFGYAGGFENLNQWFFKLPLAYTYREAGKFYALFLACLLVLVAFFVSQKEFWPKRLAYVWKGEYIVNIFLVLVFVSNYLLFLPIPVVIKPTVFPEIISQTEKKCAEDYKVLMLPISIHSTADYNPVPHLNPVRNLVNCPLLKVEYAAVKELGGEKILPFSQNQKASEVKQALSEAVATKDVSAFIAFLRQEKTGILVLNTYSDKEIKSLNVILIQQNWEYQRDGATYVYYLPRE